MINGQRVVRAASTAALAVAGLLQDHVGGNSVKPYQPAGYWSYLNFPKREWENSSGEGLYRRGVYTYWCRTFLHPSLAAFDASTREALAGALTGCGVPETGTLIDELERRKLRYGLATLCVGGGMGTATIIERV